MNTKGPVHTVNTVLYNGCITSAVSLVNVMFHWNIFLILFISNQTGGYISL